MSICETCKGRKTVILSAKKSPLGVDTEVECPECQGMGEVGNPDICQRCNGSKTIIDTSMGFNIEVDCPDCSAPVVLK